MSDKSKVIRALASAQRVGVASDNHQNTAAVEQAVRYFAKMEVDAVIHLGDIGSPAMLRRFATFPLALAIGNTDDPIALGQAAERVGVVWSSTDLTLDVGGHTVYATHGHLHRLPPADCKLVLHGHTHQVRDEILDGVRFCNPGALYRARRWTAAVWYPEVETFTVQELPRNS